MYVYRLDQTRGFELRGRITHLAAEEQQRMARGWYPSDRFVERSLYIGDTLYTLSRGMIKAHALADLSERGSLMLPGGPFHEGAWPGGQ